MLADLRWRLSPMYASLLRSKSRTERIIQFSAHLYDEGASRRDPVSIVETRLCHLVRSNRARRHNANGLSLLPDLSEHLAKGFSVIFFTGADERTQGKIFLVKFQASELLGTL